MSREYTYGKMKVLGNVKRYVEEAFWCLHTLFRPSRLCWSDITRTRYKNNLSNLQIKRETRASRETETELSALNAGNNVRDESKLFPRARGTEGQESSPETARAGSFVLMNADEATGRARWACASVYRLC